MACEANGGADGCNNALIASAACAHFFDVCGSHEPLANTATAKGRFGDRKGRGASTDARRASNAASRRSALASSTSAIGADKSHTCAIACEIVTSILDRMPGASMAPAIVSIAVSARSADVCNLMASKAADPAEGPLISSKAAAVVRSSKPSAVALPHAPPFLRFFALALLC